MTIITKCDSVAGSERSKMTSSKIHRRIGLVRPIVEKPMRMPEYEDAYTTRRLSLPLEITRKLLGKVNPARRCSRRLHNIGGVICAEYSCPVCHRHYFDHISDIRSFNETCGRFECMGKSRILYLHEYAPLTEAWASLVVQLYQNMRLDHSKELYNPVEVIEYLRPKYDTMCQTKIGMVELHLRKDKKGYGLDDLRIVIRADGDRSDRTSYIIAKGGYTWRKA